MPRNINKTHRLKVARAPLGQKKSKSLVMDKSSVRPACDQAMDSTTTCLPPVATRKFWAQCLCRIYDFFTRWGNATAGSVRQALSARPRAMRNVVEVEAG